MAARVTKLLLQNCLEARPGAASKKGSKAGKVSGGVSVKIQAAGSKKSSRRRKNKTQAKSSVRFLDVAQKELKQSDKTKENLRKLKTRANDKSKRLMAKALDKRQALRL